VVIAVFGPTLFLHPVALDGTILPVLPLSRVGSALCILSLLIAVVILVNLEASLRAATGRKRWQIKFMLLGVGSIFAIDVQVCFWNLRSLLEFQTALLAVETKQP
jgi:hypothetical protein